MSLQPGAVFAGFTIERELGAGGMGVVYLARHPRLPRHVALKLLRTDLGADPSFVGRFQREAETVARLDHPNIVPIDDCGADEGHLWLSMRYINGSTADKALAAYGGGMPPDRAVHIVEKVASALDFAHRQNVIHRDVKPANILLGEPSDDNPEPVFLSDFGVAKAMGEIEMQATALTAIGGVVATIDYAAPEQIEGRPLDGRCDSYALGCVLYKLLTGRVPYPGDTLAAKVYARMHTTPPPPSQLNPAVPAAFDQVVAKALSAAEGERFQTCRALAVAARQALTGAGNTTTERVNHDADPTELVGSGPRNAGRPHPGPANPGPATPGPRNTGPINAGPTVLAPAAFGPDRFTPAGRGATSGEHLPAELAGLMGPRPPVVPERHQVRNRSLLAVGAVVLVAAVVVAVILVRGGAVTGWASAGAGTTTSQSASASSSTSPVSSSSDTTSSSSADTTTSATGPTPVAGLPHSDPLSTNTLLISRNTDGKFDLYPVDVDSGTVGKALLTTPVAAGQNSLLSPDRGSVIYVQFNTKGLGDSIRTAAADGSGDRVLFAKPSGCVSMARPGWNPVDTGQLAIACTAADQTVTLQIVDLQGKVIRSLTTGLAKIDDLSFSSTGQLTYWGSNNKAAGDGAIFTQPADGSAGPTQITDSATGDADPVWSPDGSHIAFRRIVKQGTAGYAQIAVVDVSNSEVSVLTNGKSNSQGPAWSPDGSMIAFKNNAAVNGGQPKDEVWVMSVDGSGVRRLGVGDSGSVFGSPAWGAR